MAVTIKKMKYGAEILTSVLSIAGGVIATVTAYHYGGKQKAKTGEIGSISEGAKTLIETSKLLLENLQNQLEKEQEETQTVRRS